MYSRIGMSLMTVSDPRLVVGLDKIAVVAVRRNEHDLLGCNAHQIRGGRYDQIFLQHDEAKVTTPWECKDMDLVQMYEIARLMYEITI